MHLKCGKTWLLDQDTNERQPCLFLVNRWDHLHLEIIGLLNFREFDQLSFGCSQGRLDPIKTGLFAKGQILDHLPHDLESSVIFASLGLKD